MDFGEVCEVVPWDILALDCKQNLEDEQVCNPRVRKCKVCAREKRREQCVRDSVSEKALSSSDIEASADWKRSCIHIFLAPAQCNDGGEILAICKYQIF